MPTSSSWCAVSRKKREYAGLSCPNVSFCEFVVTLHGRARGPEERGVIEETVRGVPGVRDVVNKIPET